MPCAYRELTMSNSIDKGAKVASRSPTRPQATPPVASKEAFCFPQAGTKECCAIDMDTSIDMTRPVGPPATPPSTCSKPAPYDYSNPGVW